MLELLILIMVFYVFFSAWLLRKCKKREENLEFLIFWATMFLGKNMKNNQIFSKEEHIEKNLNDLQTK